MRSRDCSLAAVAAERGRRCDEANRAEVAEGLLVPGEERGVRLVTRIKWSRGHPAAKRDLQPLITLRAARLPRAAALAPPATSRPLRPRTARTATLRPRRSRKRDSPEPFCARPLCGRTPAIRAHPIAIDQRAILRLTAKGRRRSRPDHGTRGDGVLDSRATAARSTGTVNQGSPRSRARPRTRPAVAGVPKSISGVPLVRA